MPDFVVVVVATAAMLAGPASVPGASTVAPGAAASVTSSTPTVASRAYHDAASCEQAAAALVAPPNARFVCVPVEAAAGEMASAY